MISRLFCDFFNLGQTKNHLNLTISLSFLGFFHFWTDNASIFFSISRSNLLHLLILDREHYKKGQKAPLFLCLIPYKTCQKADTMERSPFSIFLFGTDFHIRADYYITKLQRRIVFSITYSPHLQRKKEHCWVNPTMLFLLRKYICKQP